MSTDRRWIVTSPDGSRYPTQARSPEQAVRTALEQQQGVTAVPQWPCRAPRGPQFEVRFAERPELPCWLLIV